MIFIFFLDFIEFDILYFIFLHFAVGFDIVHFRFRFHFRFRHYRFGFVCQPDQLQPEKEQEMIS